MQDSKPGLLSENLIIDLLCHTTVWTALIMMFQQQHQGKPQNKQKKTKKHYTLNIIYK